jgi:hypothetical protein
MQWKFANASTHLLARWHKGMRAHVWEKKSFLWAHGETSAGRPWVLIVIITTCIFFLLHFPLSPLELAARPGGCGAPVRK